MSLFGKSAKSVSRTIPLWETLSAHAQNALSGSALMAQDFAKSPTQYFGAAGFTQEQEDALNALRELSGDITPEDFDAKRAMYENPYLEDTIAPMIGDVREATGAMIGDIGSGATEAGGFGGTRQALLESEALRNAQREIGRISAATRAQGYESAADRAIATLARAQDVEAGRIGTMFDIGSQRQAVNQRNLDAPALSAQFLSSMGRAFPAGSTTLGASSAGSQGSISRVTSGINDIVGTVSNIGKLAMGGGSFGGGGLSGLF